jgi:hypothetical protein
MSIDTSGKWWKGSDAGDLITYLDLLLKQQSFPAERFVQSVCNCGEKVFRLSADRREGYAKRTCLACGNAAFIGDSQQSAGDAKPKKVKCKCKHDAFEIVVAFSQRSDGEIKWLTVGERCTNCGILGAYVDWGIDYAPTNHLYSMV